MSAPWRKAAAKPPPFRSRSGAIAIIDGVGNDVNIEFVDTTMTGEFRLTIDPSEKDALLYVPGAGLTMSEQMGMSDKTQRFNRTDGTHLGTGTQPLPESMNEFTRMERSRSCRQPPAVKFKDLEAAVNSTIKYNLLPMKVRADFIPVTGSSMLPTSRFSSTARTCSSNRKKASPRPPLICMDASRPCRAAR